MKTTHVPRLIRRLWALLILIFLICANVYAQKISLHFKDTPISVILKEITRQTGYDFVYSNALKEVAERIDFSYNTAEVQISKLMETLFAERGISFKINARQIVLAPSRIVKKSDPGLPERTARITGLVTDEQGEPLPGVTVMNRNSGKFTTSDMNGSYAINAAEGNILLFSSIGMADHEVPVGKSRLLDVAMSVDVITLDDVVVTGYQTISKERASGSFATISARQLATRMETNILDKFEGMIPGLFVNNGQISIRGISTLYGNQDPLYVVDGFPYEGDISGINPSDVINITVLKDAAAASIYGARAANGVIVITTRSGAPGKVAINFNASFFITPLPDVSYLDLMSSAEIVDMQQELFNMRHQTDDYKKQRATKPKALQALYDHESGLLSDQALANTLDRLRRLDNREQIESLLLQPKFKQQYNLSLAGGTEVNRYYASVNYISGRGYDKGGSSRAVNLNLKDQIKITKWLDADLGVAVSLNNNTFAPLNATSYFTMNMPYEMLKDEAGNLTSWSKFKSEKELERLRQLGLYDETYNPLTDRDHILGSGSGNYIRMQGGLNVRFMEGLKLNIMYQTERGASYSKTIYDKDSYFAKKTINDAAQLKNGEIIKNVPDGGQIYENRGDSKAYTFRGQLNFDRNFAGKHQVNVIAGAEMRAVALSSTRTHRFGYNDATMQYISVNGKDLANIKGTQSIYDDFSYNETQENAYQYNEDRYISFYANAGYTFLNKYNFTASVRVDDSNLFGSDPKFRYLPMWSAGVNWNLKKENFLLKTSWINKLNLRVTYGINGNVVRKIGPFLQAMSLYNAASESVATRIIYPPNKSLRWEKTEVTNIGVDFSLLGDRISGTLDYYYKASSDLLGEKELDPTNAFTSSLINYGNMKNQGVELGLNTVNVRTKSFTWSSGLNISYNKNKITNINTKADNILTYLHGLGVDKVGYPMKSLFVYKWAGLNPENGTPLIYDKEGNIIKNCDESGNGISNVKDPKDLEYAGSALPTYTIGFNNTFSWKGLSLSVYIIANGGNVLYDAAGEILKDGNFDRNLPTRASNFWRKPGDEKIPGVMPAPDLNWNSSSDYATLWFCSDINTVKADYIKVRNITLSYEFQKGKILKNIISGARLSFQVQNPFKWVANDRGLDPEAYSAASVYAKRTLPVTPCYMLGLDITF